MESEETFENSPGKKLERNTVDDVDDHALAPALEGAAGRLTALDSSGLEGRVSESAKDDDDDDDEVEYDDEDMFFDQHFDPVPPERLHRNYYMKEPMGEWGGTGERGTKLEF